MNIENVLTGLKRKFPLFRAVIARLDFIHDESVGTAATDGRYVWYSESFMKDLTFSQQMFIMAHEISHVALNHIERGKDKNHMLWNIATDAVINSFLSRDGLAWVPGIIDMPGAYNRSADDIYQELLRNTPMDVFGNPSLTEKSHSYWDKENEEKNPDSPSPGDGKENGARQYTDEPSFFGDNIKKREEAIKKMKEAIANGTKGAGVPGLGESPVRAKDIQVKKSSVVDWRKLLKESVNLELDYSMKNATVEDGVVVSRLEEIPTAETEILLDTSGSIDDRLLRGFLMECLNILEYSKVRIACFDDMAYDFQEIRNPHQLSSLELQGGGGTNFNAAVKAFSRRCDNKIIFTDGEGEVTNPDPDIIWIVFGDSRYLPKKAKIIEVDPEEFIRKYKSEMEKQLKNQG